MKNSAQNLETKSLVWRDIYGKRISCFNKNKILNENLSELIQIFQDALDDAVLLGCEAQHSKKMMLKTILKLNANFKNIEKS